MFTLPLIIALAVQTATKTPPDFAFRFDHKGCHYEYVDTFQGTYSHVGQTPRIPFTLSEPYRQILSTAIVESRFFYMPRFAPDAGSGDASDNFELEVRMDGRRWTVAWTLSSPRPFTQLERFFVPLFRMLEYHPDVMRLPRRGDGCPEGPPAVR